MEPAGALPLAGKRRAGEAEKDAPSPRKAPHSPSTSTSEYFMSDSDCGSQDHDPVGSPGALETSPKRVRLGGRSQRLPAEPQELSADETQAHSEAFAMPGLARSEPPPTCAPAGVPCAGPCAGAGAGGTGAEPCAIGGRVGSSSSLVRSAISRMTRPFAGVGMVAWPGIASAAPATDAACCGAPSIRHAARGGASATAEGARVAGVSLAGLGCVAQSASVELPDAEDEDGTRDEVISGALRPVETRDRGFRPGGFGEAPGCHAPRSAVRRAGRAAWAAPEGPGPLDRASQTSEDAYGAPHVVDMYDAVHECDRMRVGAGRDARAEALARAGAECVQETAPEGGEGAEGADADTEADAAAFDEGGRPLRGAAGSAQAFDACGRRAPPASGAGRAPCARAEPSDGGDRAVCSRQVSSSMRPLGPRPQRAGEAPGPCPALSGAPSSQASYTTALDAMLDAAIEAERAADAPAGPRFGAAPPGVDAKARAARRFSEAASRSSSVSADTAWTVTGACSAGVALADVPGIRGSFGGAAEDDEGEQARLGASASHGSVGTGMVAQASAASMGSLCSGVEPAPALDRTDEERGDAGSSAHADAGAFPRQPWAAAAPAAAAAVAAAAAPPRLPPAHPAARVALAPAPAPVAAAAASAPAPGNPFASAAAPAPRDPFASADGATSYAPAAPAAEALTPFAPASAAASAHGDEAPAPSALPPAPPAGDADFVEAALAYPVLCALVRREQEARDGRCPDAAALPRIEGVLAAARTLATRAGLRTVELPPEVVLTLLWLVDSWHSQHCSRLDGVLCTYLALNPDAERVRAPLAARMTRAQVELLRRLGWDANPGKEAEVVEAEKRLQRLPGYEALCSFVKGEVERRWAARQRRAAQRREQQERQRRGAGSGTEDGRPSVRPRRAAGAEEAPDQPAAAPHDRELAREMVDEADLALALEREREAAEVRPEQIGGRWGAALLAEA